MKTPRANFSPGVSAGGDQPCREADVTQTRAPRQMPQRWSCRRPRSAQHWVSSASSARSKQPPLPPILCARGRPRTACRDDGHVGRAVWDQRGPALPPGPADLRRLAAAGTFGGGDRVVTPAESKAAFRRSTNKRLNAPALGAGRANHSEETAPPRFNCFFILCNISCARLRARSASHLHLYARPRPLALFKASQRQPL